METLEIDLIISLLTEIGFFSSILVPTRTNAIETNTISNPERRIKNVQGIFSKTPATFAIDVRIKTEFLIFTAVVSLK